MWESGILTPLVTMDTDDLAQRDSQGIVPVDTVREVKVSD